MKANMVRRNFLKLGAAIPIAVITSLASSATQAIPTRLLFVHGRSQEGKDPDRLKSLWMDALKRGVEKLGRGLPDRIDVRFPFYGDALDNFAQQYEVPLTLDIQTKGSQVNEEFLAFQAEVAEALRQRAGITDDQVNTEYGPNPKPKGPQNWEWVQAILRALDKHVGGMTQTTLEVFMRDVFLYTNRAGVRDEIDRIVAREITEQPTVVVGHSLGSVVIYSVLRTDRRSLRVPLCVTLGSPLGIQAIRNQFRPLRFPPPVKSWFNAFDKRDVVALYPLDTQNFPVEPAIENDDAIRNHTANRHGITGYLDSPAVAKRILDALGATASET